ncbi:hypothetical protein EJB05_18046 [Eragrostis curvula]|uniref:TF-B3 domain-containing protein n=1 Tax=Eragrostis curvula TaxID=38414 RepID=A0A5J9VM70_9POAL|nr:hypothetical protein EJB05_18046 [Eragrostis curvula]
MVGVILALKKEQEEGVVDIDSDEEGAEKVVKRRKKKACDPHKKRACVDCTKRCSRIHGQVSSSSRPTSAVPSFFKVMMGYFSDDMDIPPPFAKTILDLAGSNIYLEDSFGLRWRVRLCLRDGVLSFGHGWKNFVLDHAVSCGEFLVFRLIARSVFTVQMFAPSAVERLYLCERNKRQSRKRKPRQKTSSPGTERVKIGMENRESCKKKRRTDGQNDQVPIDCKMSVHVCIDDSDVPDSESELKCSENSEKASEARGAESQEVSEIPARHHGKAQMALAGETERAEDTMFTEKETQCNAHLASDATEHEHEHGEGSSSPTNVDNCGPLAMMDLNEVSIDDIYLSADMYEFESDLCNTQAYSFELNMEGRSTSGQTSGFNSLENGLQNQHSSMEVGQGFEVSEKLSCIENKQVTDVLGTCTGDVNVPEHDIDIINMLPDNDPSSLGDDNPSPTDAEVPSSEWALRSCNKDNSLCKGNQAEQKEVFVSTYSSVIQDKPRDGQVDIQDSTGQHAPEIMSSSQKPLELTHLRKDSLETGNNSGDLQSGSTESGGILALEADGVKFSIAVPAPGQTWLELPSRLPVLPRMKKQRRKVVILKDPCMRRWPVLYQCTPGFSGFISGWVDISRENRLQEGDICEFEFSGNHELSFQLTVTTSTQEKRSRLKKKNTERSLLTVGTTEDTCTEHYDLQPSMKAKEIN